jgi:hypothetical protein
MGSVPGEETGDYRGDRVMGPEETTYREGYIDGAIAASIGFVLG